MSTTRRCLKSPLSLSGTSTHPIMVTQRSRSWPWMIDSRPFHFMPIGPFIQGYISKRKSYIVGKFLIYLLPFRSTSIRPTITDMELFRNITLKNPRSGSWVVFKVNVTLLTQYPTDALPFYFVHFMFRINHSYDMVNGCLKITSEISFLKNHEEILTECLQHLNKLDLRDIAVGFCSDCSVKLIEAKWCLCAIEVTHVGSDNSLPSVLREATVIRNQCWLISIRALPNILVRANIMETESEQNTFHSRMWMWKYRLQNVEHFDSFSNCQICTSIFPICNLQSQLRVS